MKINSLRFKLLGAVICCLAVAAAIILTVLHVSFVRQADQLSLDAVNEARKAFDDREQADINKLAAVLASIQANDAFREPYTGATRDELYRRGEALFAQLKGQYHFTLWQFNETEATSKVFLRMHNPAKFGDPVNRWMYNECVRTQKLVAGKELGHSGFALRVMAPYHDHDGKVLGYMEVGEEIGRFFGAMKEQTGNDYALVLKKSLLAHDKWTDFRKSQHQADNWDDSPSVVAGDRTTEDTKLLRIEDDPDSLAKDGQVTGKVEDGGETYVRGLFPVSSADGKRAGAVMVAKNMTPAFASLRALEWKIGGVILLVTAVICLVISMAMSRFVFRRLDNMIETATMVVGGDFNREIHKSADDEVGQFESLFEQFRRVFVSVIQP